MLTLRLSLVVLLSGLLLPAAEGDWPVYGHDSGGQRYSPLTAINKTNVKSLQVAWTFRTGDGYQPPSGSRPTQFEATPLYVDGKLFISTPLGRVIALDPVKGTQLWAYDPHIKRDEGYGDFSNRGVSTWSANGHPRRIFVATIDARLIALDAATGQVCSDFGSGGVIDLRQGLRIAPHWYSDYEETSPPAVMGDLVVLGSAVADNGSVGQASGEVRAFDALTGKLRWTWDPIPQNASDPAFAQWKNGGAQRTGAANAWSILAVDPARQLIFVPTGSPSPDYYGGERLGNNSHANSIVALRAQTGEVVWHFQTVHHDLWDYDVATPPLLFDMHRDGKVIPAIAVGSKTGNLFLLNRETGEPLFTVEERPVPASDIPGEQASPTQPVPVKPVSVARQHFSPDDVFGLDDADREWCRNEISKLRYDGMFTPPSLQGTLVVPGNVGGQNWGGMTYDPVRNLLIFPTSNFAAEVRLIKRDDYESLRDSRNRKLDGDWEFAPQRGTPYGMMRRFLLSPKHVPCVRPPWGEMVAISPETGEKKWDVPFGRLSGRLPKEWGSIILGGPMSTAGGLTFSGGTLFPELYALDSETGEQLWAGPLPASAKAVPMTFEGPDGKQYVVVCAGGYGDAKFSPTADYVVAFRL